MATFLISKRLSGDYKYEYLNRRGKTIFTSNAFELRFECEHSIELLKEKIEEIIFMRFKSGKGKFYFRIILREQEIAVSRKFSTSLMLEKGIKQISTYAKEAEVLDFSNPVDVFGPE